MHHGLTRVSIQVALLALIPAMAGAQAIGASTPDDAVPVALVDPSLRSPLAAPTVQWVGEVANDSKRVTGKVGFAMSPQWFGEVGMTGAFDRDWPHSPPSSLRALTGASSLWGAATWTRPRAGRRVTPVISGRLEASRRAFEFYDLALTRHTDTHATYAVTATAGVRLPREALLAVSYRWREAWQVADDPTTCQFSADAGTTSCQADHLFLAPASSRRHQLETQLHLRVARTVGAEAFLTRDFWSHAWGLDVPVYFIARPDGGFTGGMVLTYDGARAHLDISVFVGQVFHFTK